MRMCNLFLVLVTFNQISAYAVSACSTTYSRSWWDTRSFLVSFELDRETTTRDLAFSRAVVRWRLV